MTGLLLLVAAMRAERLPTRVFTTADGLPREEVLAIVQDSHGYLWIATPEGLARYDGYRFTTFGPEQGLSSVDVSAFFETRAGIYWLGTRSGYFCRYDPAAAPSRTRFDCHQPANRPGIIVSFREDAQGAVWAATTRGVFRSQGARGPFEQVLFDRPEVRVKAMGIFAAADGSIWVSTGGKSLYRRRDGRIDRFDMGSRPDDEAGPSPLMNDRQGRLWAGTSEGLRRLEPAARPGDSAVIRTYTTSDGLPDNQIYAICETRDGSIWIGTARGLARFDGSRFQAYTSVHGIPANVVYALAEDRDGNLWAGGYLGGLIKLSRKGFSVYGSADGVPASETSVFLNREEEACVIGYSPGKATIHCFGRDRLDSAELPLRPLVSENWFAGRAVLQDHTGEWWIGTADGLYRYAAAGRLALLRSVGPKAVYREVNSGFSLNRIFHLFEDSRGDIWIGTEHPDETVIWRRTTGRFEALTASDMPDSRKITSVWEDRSGTMWLGFFKVGAGRLRAGRIGMLEAVERLSVWQIYGARRGRIWMAGAGGLSRIDNPAADSIRPFRYSRANGLSSDEVLCVTEDASGRIYAGTARGLDRLDPDSGQITHYTTLDGLSGNRVTSAVRDRYGALWFGASTGGITRLDPQPEAAEGTPPARITGLRIDGIAHPVSESGTASLQGVSVRPGQKHLEIDFLAIDLSSVEDLQYQYMLRDEDSDWSPATRNRTVSYASLARGSHEFLVRSLRPPGQPGTPASLRFYVEPPFWRTWWFTALALGSVAWAIYLGHRARVRRLIDLERVRTRIATDLHDDIGSSLSQIALLSEVAQREPDGQATLTRIGAISRELVDSMSDVVWSIDPRRDHLGDLVHRMKRFAGDVLPARDIEYTFTAEGLPRELRLDPDTRRNVYLIFKEALHNLIRHSGCSQARIEIQVKGDWLMLMIEDDGKGLAGTTGSREDGHGLASMRSRAAALGGSLAIGPGARAGVSVTVKVPTRPVNTRR